MKKGKTGMRRAAAVATRWAMMKDVDFLICLDEVEAALVRLKDGRRGRPPGYEAMLRFCRALREAKLQLKSVLRLYGNAFGAVKLRDMAAEAVAVLPRPKRGTPEYALVYSIRRHCREIKAAMGKRVKVA